MKLTIDRDVFAAALDKAVGVIPTRAMPPVTGDVHLRADGETLIVEATDLDRWLRCRIPARIEEAGSQLADARMLRQYVKALPSGGEVAAQGGERLSLRCGQSKARIPSHPVEDFPAFKNDGAATEFVLPDAAALFSFLSPAMSNEQTRAYLNGIHIRADGEKLRLCATNGHILARCDIALPLGATGLPGIIVPREAIPRLIDMADDGLLIRANGRILEAEAGPDWLATRLIDLDYPEYDRATPESHALHFTAPRDALLGAMNRLAALSTHIPAYRLELKRGELLLSLGGDNGAGGEEVVEVDYGGDEASFGFAHAVLLPAVRWCGEAVRIGGDNNFGAVTITDAERPDWRFVAMQYRVNPAQQQAA